MRPKQCSLRHVVLLIAMFLLAVNVAKADAECSLERDSYGPYTIWRVDDMLVFTSGMTVDADGSPRAYHPDDESGLDALHNAGSPGNWSALAVVDGEPVVQGPDDEAPGYYVSMTSLEDHSIPDIVPSRFVNSERVPYIVLPADLPGPRLGDLAMVINTRNGKSSPAIFADYGPAHHLGEGSIRLADALGLNSDARSGGTDRGMVFVVFGNSGERRPLTSDMIAQRTAELQKDHLDVDEVNACVSADPT